MADQQIAITDGSEHDVLHACDGKARGTLPSCKLGLALLTSEGPLLGILMPVGLVGGTSKAHDVAGGGNPPLGVNHLRVRSCRCRCSRRENCLWQRGHSNRFCCLVGLTTTSLDTSLDGMIACDSHCKTAWDIQLSLDLELEAPQNAGEKGKPASRVSRGSLGSTPNHIRSERGGLQRSKTSDSLQD